MLKTSLFAIAASLMAAACALSPQERFSAGRPYPTFEAGLRASIYVGINLLEGGTSRDAVIDCYVAAVSKSVPDDDKARILAAMNSGAWDAEATALLDKWAPTGTRGTAAGWLRLQNNAKDICPDIYGNYPDAFG